MTAQRPLCGRPGMGEPDMPARVASPDYKGACDSRVPVLPSPPLAPPETRPRPLTKSYGFGATHNGSTAAARGPPHAAVLRMERAARYCRCLRIPPAKCPPWPGSSCCLPEHHQRVGTVYAMSNELRPGMYRAGMLIDGQEATPYLAGSLSYDPGHGPQIEVPYVRGEPQFEVAQSWFMQKDLPRGLSFHDPDGTVTLTGLRWRGDRQSDVSIGRLDARLAIFERATHLLDEYHLKTVCSRIDGLHDFAGFESITTAYDRMDDRWRTVITVHPKDRVRVEHNGYTYTIRATTPGMTSGLEVIVRADAVIETTKENGATVDEHIAAQWPVRALLTLTFGIPLFWREHQLLDDQFPTWMIGGPPRSPMHVPLLFERTIRDHEQPEGDRRDLLVPVRQDGVRHHR